MRVVLLAPSKAGKTSLLTAAYGHFSSRTSQTFGLEIDNGELRQRLAEYIGVLQSKTGEARFKDIVGTVAVDAYPVIMDWKQSVAGSLSRQCDFTIVDLPGGAFSRADASVARPDDIRLAPVINSEIDGADMFIAVAPFDLVYLESQETYFQDLQLGISQIRKRLYAAYERKKHLYTPDKPMSIVVALTRSDRLGKMIKPEDHTEEVIKGGMMVWLGKIARGFIMKSFEGLMSKDNVQVYLVATSLGADIEGKGSFKPDHVDLPFVYAAWQTLLTKAERLLQEKTTSSNAAATCRKDAETRRRSARSKDNEASGLRSEAELAKQKKIKNFFTGKSKALIASADTAASRASELRTEASDLDSQAASHDEVAAGKARERDVCFQMAADTVDHIRASLSDHCYIIKGGYYMQPAARQGDAHLLALTQDKKVDTNLVFNA